MFLSIRGAGAAAPALLPAALQFLSTRFTIHFDSGRAASLDGNCAAPYDVIIASDLVYSAMGARLLARSVADNLKRGGVFLMVSGASGSDVSSPPRPSTLCNVFMLQHTAIHSSQAHTKRLAIFFGEDGQLQRESSDSGLDEFCAALMLPSGP
jgi:hypothetical protein